MSKLIQKHLAKLAARIEPKQLPQDISKLLSQHIKQHDPNTVVLRSQYSAHFNDLFSGLTTLQTPSPLPEAEEIKLVSNSDTFETLARIEMAYYHGTLSYKLASTAMGNAKLRVREIATIVRYVDKGGTLVKWSILDHLFFNLQAASRLWGLGHQDLARRMICESFDQCRDWLHKSIDKLPSHKIRILAQALRAASPQLAGELVDQVDGIRVLWIMWAELKGDVRDKVLEKLDQVLHSEIVDTLRENPRHSGLLKTSPATEAQALQVLHRLDLVADDICPPAEGFLSLANR